MRLLKKRVLIAAGVVGTAYIFLVYRFWFVCDDAFISFRYARNLASGLGLRYNLGTHQPVEGYSNFAWVLLCAVFEKFGLDPTLFAPLVSIGSGIALLWLVYVVARDELRLKEPAQLFAVAFLALFPPFAVWSTGGLATMPFALALFYMAKLVVFGEKRRAIYIACVVAIIISLLRSEGLLWVIGVCAVAAFVRRNRSPFSKRDWLTCAAVLAIAVSFHLMWRHGYYGQFIPNSVHAKSTINAAVIGRGFDYVAVFFLSFLPFFLLIPATLLPLSKKFRSNAAPLIAYSWAAIIFAICVGGDFMAMGRLMVPAFAFVALLSGCCFEHLFGGSSSRRGMITLTGILLLALNLLPGYDKNPVPDSVMEKFHFRLNRQRHHSEYQQWVFQNIKSEIRKKLGIILADLSKPGDTLVYGGLGNVGYYSNLYIHDVFGLVTREVAELPTPEQLRSPGHDKAVPQAFFLKYKPTFMHAKLIGGTPSKRRVRKDIKRLQEIAARTEYSDYILEVRTIPEPSLQGVLLLLRRRESGESKEQAAVPDEPA